MGSEHTSSHNPFGLRLSQHPRAFLFLNMKHGTFSDPSSCSLLATQNTILIVNPNNAAKLRFNDLKARASLEGVSTLEAGTDCF